MGNSHLCYLEEVLEKVHINPQKEWFSTGIGTCMPGNLHQRGRGPLGRLT